MSGARWLVCEMGGVKRMAWDEGDEWCMMARHEWWGISGERWVWWEINVYMRRYVRWVKEVVWDACVCMLEDVCLWMCDGVWWWCDMLRMMEGECVYGCVMWCDADEMMRWWDDEMMRWWDDEMMRWWDDEMMRWWDDEMMRRWGDEEMRRWGDEEIVHMGKAIAQKGAHIFKDDIRHKDVCTITAGDTTRAYFFRYIFFKIKLIIIRSSIKYFF